MGMSALHDSGVRAPGGEPSGPPALELRGLTKRYDGTLLALDAFDLVVRDGEFFGLLDPTARARRR